MSRPALQARSERLADEVGVERVTVYVWDDDTPNLFALGSPRRGHAVVSTAALDALTDEEALACIGHGLAHARHGQALRLGGLLAGGLGLAASGAAALVTRRGRRAGLAGGLLSTAAVGPLWAAFARATERTADRAGAIETGRGVELASALVTVHSGGTADDPETYSPPRRTSLQRLLATHPPIRERIDSLIRTDSGA